MKKVSELPYSRVSAEALHEALAAITDRVRNAASAADVLAAREDYLKQASAFSTASSLAYMHYTCNTADPFWLAEKAYYDEIGPAAENDMLQYAAALLDSPFRPELEQALSPLLFRSMELQRKSMSPEIIGDMVEENRLVSEYSRLMAGMEFPFRGEKLPRAMLMKYASSPDRETRRACYAALGTTLGEHAAALDGLFDRLVHVRDRMAKKLGYPDFVPLGYCRMGRLCYGEAEVKQFRENILTDIVPLVAELRTRNAKRLGVDRMMLYDNESFVPGAPPVPCPKDGIFAAARRMYHAMGKETGDFIDLMLETEAFDVDARKNKWGGGYCTEFMDYRQPFILANFNGTASDVDVVTHEAGHALNSYLIRNNRFALELAEGGMETAETHSMSMEFFAEPYMESFFPAEGAADKYRFQHMLDALSFLPYGTMVDHFQHIVYAHPDMTPAERNAAWLSLEQQYRPHLGLAGIPYLEQGTRWQYQMHIYEVPFYYIDYCLAQTAAFQFLMASREDYDGAFRRYLRFSRQGGEKVWTELLQEAGLRSPFEPGALRELAAKLRTLLEAELE